jgi:hypothetical protein
MPRVSPHRLNKDFTFSLKQKMSEQSIPLNTTTTKRKKSKKEQAAYS